MDYQTQCITGDCLARAFDAAQQRLAGLTCRLSNEELLVRLKALLKKTGYLGVRLIDKSRDLPSACTYRHRFGDLATAYRLIGYTVVDPGAKRRRILAQFRWKIWEELKANLREHGVHLRCASLEPYKIHASGAPILNFALARALGPKALYGHGPAWMIRIPRPAKIGRAVIGILSSDRTEILQYVIVPCLRKTPVRKYVLTIPLIANKSLATFRTPAEFYDAIHRAGFFS